MKRCVTKTSCAPMKRFGLAVGLIALLTMASPDAGAQVRFGVFAGLSYTSLRDVDFGSRRAVYDSRSGYQLGGFIDMSSGAFAFRPGIGYMNMGAVFENGLSAVVPDVDDSFDLSYLFIPVDIRLRLGLPLVQPYLHFGPELRFLSDTGGADPAFEDNIRSFNVSGSIGGGVELGLGVVRLMPEFRFAFDLSGLTSDAWEVRGVTFQADEEPRARAFVIRLGAAF